jgi:hypothetical protein
MMLKIMLIILLLSLLFIPTAQAREAECFLGIVGLEQDYQFNFYYKSDLLVRKEKHHWQGAPFFGCGIKFDI